MICWNVIIFYFVFIPKTYKHNWYTNICHACELYKKKKPIKNLIIFVFSWYIAFGKSLRDTLAEIDQNINMLFSFSKTCQFQTRLRSLYDENVDEDLEMILSEIRLIVFRNAVNFYDFTEFFFFVSFLSFIIQFNI